MMTAHSLFWLLLLMQEATVSAQHVETIVLKKYADSAAVMAALQDGSLDAVMGAGVLEPADLKTIQNKHASDFHVFLGPPIQNRVIILNANKAPTDDLKLRKVIMHAVNKAAIIDKEFSGLAEPVDSLFPKNAPYCNVDLTPRWDFDFEKATLLQCPAPGAAPPIGCDTASVDFIVTKGDALLAKLEDDVRADLAKVGISVTTRFLEKDDFNSNMTSGNFNLCFSETWGPPYDPHSFAASWKSPDEGHFAALKGMKAPVTQAQLTADITNVMVEEDLQKREQQWKDILTAMHEQAIDLPFSGKRIPTVMRTRLAGYVPGQQQFDYPVQSLQVLSGSKTITVAPGGQTGLFSSIGRLDPHTYRPNEFFASNWVYEGLVAYGADGVIEPSLAVSWKITDKAGGGQEFRFMLRTGVKFHDGSDWDCSVAKLNFDHVLAKPLTTGDWHGWYDLPSQIQTWSCPGTYEFVLTTKDKYYPLLQELTYIRPLRMLSPAMFASGSSTDPKTENSCHKGWGEIEGLGEKIVCAGIKGVAGTGPFRYIETMQNGDAKFEWFAEHWRNPPPPPAPPPPPPPPPPVVVEKLVFASTAAPAATKGDTGIDVGIVIAVVVVIILLALISCGGLFVYGKRQGAEEQKLLLSKEKKGDAEVLGNPAGEETTV